MAPAIREQRRRNSGTITVMLCTRFLLLAPLALAACGQDVSLSARAGTLTFLPDLVDAGVVPVGSSNTLDVTVAAAGHDVGLLGVDVLNVEGEWFSLEGDLPTVTEGEAETLALTYAPDEPGLHWAEITFLTDQVIGSYTIDARGEAAQAEARLFPAVVDFGHVEPGLASEAQVTVQNTGRVDLDLVGAGATGPGFSAAADPLVLTTGEEATVTVSVAPADEEPAGGVLELELVGVELPAVDLRGNDCAAATGGLYDADGDGASWCGLDCDDGDDQAAPGLAETCDGVDNDCDGTVDEGTRCYDDDGDGYSEDDGDCADADAAIGPLIVEVMGNGIDDDCDGVVDGGAWDADGDGFAEDGGDCDDTDPTVHPGATEVPDGVDQDCDGVADDGTSAYDDDGDTYTEDGGDCDDTDATVHPGATETADWRDEDCDGAVDEGTTNADDDGDGWSERGGDCDDADPTRNPGQPETAGDGIDSDCDGVD